MFFILFSFLQLGFVLFTLDTLLAAYQRETFISSRKSITMKQKLSFGTFLLPLLLVFFFTSCQKEARDVISDENMGSSSLVATSGATTQKMLETELLKSVRQSTSRFNSTTQAIQAGYMPDDHCVAVPGVGGMGYHWLKASLVDPTLDPLNPEVLLYATGQGGNLRLVAVEYIVLNVGQTAPTFGNEPFKVGGAPLPVPHWTLHVWLHEHNPSGIFENFNPNITCP
jgi:hypothetical protein